MYVPKVGGNPFWCSCSRCCDPAFWKKTKPFGKMIFLYGYSNIRDGFEIGRFFGGETILKMKQLCITCTATALDAVWYGRINRIHPTPKRYKNGRINRIHPTPKQKCCWFLSFALENSWKIWPKVVQVEKNVGHQLFNWSVLVLRQVHGTLTQVSWRWKKKTFLAHTDAATKKMVASLWKFYDLYPKIDIWGGSSQRYY